MELPLFEVISNDPFAITARNCFERLLLFEAVDPPGIDRFFTVRLFGVADGVDISIERKHDGRTGIIQRISSFFERAT